MVKKSLFYQKNKFLNLSRHPLSTYISALNWRERLQHLFSKFWN